MSKDNKKKNSSGLFSTLGRWFRRLFFGAGRELAQELEISEEEARERAKQGDVEEVVSPAKQIFRSFMSRKGAVMAVIVVVAMFLFVFIAPNFMPHYSDEYTEILHKNIEPGFSMMNVPKELKNNVKYIDSFSNFSVGLSNEGKVYVWGVTKLGTTGINVADIPEEVKSAKIEFISAGFDHVVAIGDDGKVYAWGSNRLGQYGAAEETPSILPMPDELINGKIDVSNIKEVECGYQATVILMKDGSYYIWGNKNAYRNLENFAVYAATKRFIDISFTLNNIVGVEEGAKALTTGMKGVYNKVKTDLDQVETKDLSAYVKEVSGRSIVSAEAASNMICLVLSDGSVCFVGDIVAGNSPVGLPSGVKAVDTAAGAHHITVLGDDGKVYTGGRNTFGQCNVPKNANGATSIYGGAFQNYSVDGEGNLTAKWGLSGFIFGTDEYGAPIFERVVNAGKMTMTIGAVAVIISTIIGIIIGCLSGYFGGKVDMFLMRFAEIVSSIPFLPFALVLSALMGRMTISETMRIFIIMCILGVLSWPGLARIVRGQVLVARENEYVTAAKAMGVKEGKIAFKHILPNVISVIIVTLTLDFAGCMLTESSLSYLGFGVQYPRPTWGNMLNNANNYTVISNFWWQWFFPALFLSITTICINIVGDTLRDVMDPKSSVER